MKINAAARLLVWAPEGPALSPEKIKALPSFKPSLAQGGVQAHRQCVL